MLRPVKSCTLRRPSDGENLRSSSMTPLCPLKAALNNAVDPSLNDNRDSVQVLSQALNVNLLAGSKTSTIDVDVSN